MRGKPAVFFDRDGIINVPPPPEQRYITDPADFFLLPGFTEVLRACTEHGYPTYVVTNQKCVAIGRLSEEGLHAIHARMHDLLAEENLFLDGVYYCPHQESDKCSCRKPKPGMLLRAADEHGLDLDASLLIGDQPRDCEAGKAAGCRTILVNNEGMSSPHADIETTDLHALLPILHDWL